MSLASLAGIMAKSSTCFCSRCFFRRSKRKILAQREPNLSGRGTEISGWKPGRVGVGASNRGCTSPPRWTPGLPWPGTPGPCADLRGIKVKGRHQHAGVALGAGKRRVGWLCAQRILTVYVPPPLSPDLPTNSSYQERRGKKKKKSAHPEVIKIRKISTVKSNTRNSTTKSRV